MYYFYCTMVDFGLITFLYKNRYLTCYFKRMQSKVLDLCNCLGQTETGWWSAYD